LISSDIIAFYELIKNAFDAGSQTGAEIRFVVALRRNSYTQIRDRALRVIPDGMTKTERAAHVAERLSELKADFEGAIDPTATVDGLAGIKQRIEEAKSLSEFIAALTTAYRDLNSIEISDTGTGMSVAELTRYYLTIGTPSRKHQVDQSIAALEAKAPYLGEKGIGRLSAMRLGEQLRLETARVEDPTTTVLDIDWTRFADLDAMVEDIEIAPVRGPRKPSATWSGTRLIIKDLSEDWTEKKLRDLAEYDFARLTDPFVDPKKRPRIALFWNGARIAVPWMNRTLIEHAHAAFKGEYSIVDGGPRLRVKMEAHNLGFDHPVEADIVTLTEPDLDAMLSGTSEEVPHAALTSVGPFKFEVYWYNRRSLTRIETIGNQKAVRDLQRQWSGIMLFRDGFRILPYGDDEDDWLGLDRRALSRPGYVLNKNQFVGHVEISRTANPGLVDQTNREGLRATPEEQVLLGVLGYVIREMLWSFFRDIEKRYKKTQVEVGDIKAQIETLEARAKKAITRVRGLVPKDEWNLVDDLQHALVEFRDLSSRAQQRIDEVEAEGRQMVQMAGVGLMVEVVAHELARASESALLSIERLRGNELPGELRSKLETLRAEMKTVSKRLRVLDELSVPGRQRAETFDLGQLLDDVAEGHEAQFARHKIALDISKPPSPVRVRLVKGMVVQILENLISNSVYWMALRAHREARYRPRLQIELDKCPLQLRFSDNASGISPENRERIFRAFWSLKTKGKRRGLGLFIARENANQLGGSLTLSDRKRDEIGRLREFVLELPDSALVK
jgi:signal transduction histidine kinase